jgi:WD40 repeat protein/serine/threonine protein kinase
MAEASAHTPHDTPRRIAPDALTNGGQGGTSASGGASPEDAQEDRLWDGSNTTAFRPSPPSEPAASDGPDQEPGHALFGDYELLREIARGGMGVVYRARHVTLNRPVALKMIRAGQFASPEEVQRFYLEARAAAQLDHPGIVPVHDVGEYAGQHYYAMGLVEGGSLSVRIRQRPLPPREAAAILQKVAEAVEYAHSRGIIHRDLKPGNVLLDRDGQPKVTDFGLAKMVRGDSNLTVTGQVLGTPAYMSPEQASGKSLEAGPTADVYSLGATLYCLLTGRAPFQAASTMETLRQVLEQEPVSPRQLNATVDRDLETICLKCLQKAPSRRYATAAALAADLGHWLAGEPITARPVSRLERLWRLCRRNPTVSALSVFLVLALLAGTVVSIAFAVEAHREADRTRAAKEESDSRFYDAEMLLAYQEWEKGHIRSVQERLQRWLPERNQGIDRRGFEWYYLDRLCHLDFRTLQAHTGPVWKVAFSPDGCQLATAAEDGTVTIWSAATALPIRTLAKHEGRVWSVAFSPCGRRLASGGADGKVIVWDTATGKQMQMLVSPSGPALSVAFHPRDGRLAAAWKDGVIGIFDPDKETPLRTWQHGQGSVLGMAYSPDGLRLATAGDTTVKVWEPTTDEPKHTLRGHTSYVYSVAFSPDGKSLVSASHDETVLLWDAVAGNLLRSIRAHSGGVRSVAFSPDGRRFATAGEDNMVRLWDAASGMEAMTLRGHPNVILSVAFSPDGWRLASAAGDGLVKLWDATTCQEYCSLRIQGDNCRRLAFSPDGKWIAASGCRTVKLWDVRTGRETRTLGGHPTDIQGLTFSPDSSRLATVSSKADPQGTAVSGELKLWDPATGEELLCLKGNAGRALAVAFHPDGSSVATAGWDHVVRIWDLATRAETFTLQGHRDLVQDVAFSPDGHWLATAGKDGTVRLWDATTGRQMGDLQGHNCCVLRLTFSLDSRWLATAGTDGTARVWDLASWKEIHRLRGSPDAVERIMFSPDRRRLATIGTPGGGKVWDLLTRQEVLDLDWRDVSTYDVGFSPDGTLLAVAASRPELTNRKSPARGEVRIWDARPLTPDLLAQREAGSRMRFLFCKLRQRPDVLQTLTRDESICEDVRCRSLELARQFPEEQ